MQAGVFRLLPAVQHPGEHDVGPSIPESVKSPLFPDPGVALTQLLVVSDVVRSGEFWTRGARSRAVPRVRAEPAWCSASRRERGCCSSRVAEPTADKPGRHHVSAPPAPHPRHSVGTSITLRVGSTDGGRTYGEGRVQHLQRRPRAGEPTGDVCGGVRCCHQGRLRGADASDDVTRRRTTANVRLSGSSTSSPMASLGERDPHDRSHFQRAPRAVHRRLGRSAEGRGNISVARTRRPRLVRRRRTRSPEGRGAVQVVPTSSGRLATSGIGGWTTPSVVLCQARCRRSRDSAPAADRPKAVADHASAGQSALPACAAGSAMWTYRSAGPRPQPIPRSTATLDDSRSVSVKPSLRGRHRVLQRQCESSVSEFDVAGRLDQGSCRRLYMRYCPPLHPWCMQSTPCPVSRSRRRARGSLKGPVRISWGQGAWYLLLRTTPWPPARIADAAFSSERDRE